MGNAFTPDALRGILIPDPRIAPSKTGAGSTYTQAEPQPGVPAPSSATSLVLESSGTQADTTILVQTVRAGGAVTTDAIRAGAFAWQETGGQWQGWDGPLGYAGFEPVHTWGSGGATPLYTYPHAIYTRKGTRLVSAQSTVALGVVQTCVVHRRDQSGATTITNVVSSSATGQPLHSCVLELPDRLLLLVAYDDLASAGLQVRVYASDDDGGTWALQSGAALPAYIDTTTTTVRRLRAAYQGGQVLMMLAVRVSAATVPDTLWQYASADEGMSYALVEAVPGTDAASVHTGGVHDIYAIPDVGFGVVYCGSSRSTWGATSTTLSKRLGSAYSRWTDVDPVQVGLLAPATTLSAGNQLSDDTELCAAVDEDGQVYALAPNSGNSSRVRPARSSDGETWSVLGQAANLVHSLDFGGERVTSMVAVWYAGTLHVVHTVDSTTVYNAQLGDTALSGYTSATLPMLPAVQMDADYSAGSYMTWEPWWAPDAIGWTITTIGAPTTTLTGGAMQITAGLAEVRTYTHTRTTALTAAHTVQALWEVDPDSGTATETLLTAASNTSTYRLRVRVTTTQVLCYDDVSGVLRMTHNRTGSQYVHIRAWLSNQGGTGRATVWVCEVDGIHQVARDYLRILSNDAMTDAGFTAAGQSVKIGQTGQGVSNWRYCAPQYSSQMSSPHNLSIPSQVGGRDFSSRSLTLSDGLRVRAVGGPAALDDLWTIAPRYGHGIAALASTSPSVTWRSVDTLASQVFVWETDTTAANVSPLMGPVGALYLGGTNFRTATLEGRNAFGVYVTIGTWDASAGQSGLKWVRRGNTIYPDTTASTGTYWYPHGMLDGARFTFDTAAGPVRAIQYQTEGAWTNAATKHARATLFGDVSAVALSGTAGAFLATGGLLVWNNDPSYSAYRLTIPVQQVAEAYYEIGVMVLGHLAVFGRRYSWGRTLTSEPNVELRTGANGRRTSLVAGPTRRAVEFGWTDAADQSAFGVDQTASTPDFFYASSTGTPEPAAAKMDGPALMRGIVEHLDGPSTPIVYVAHLPRVALGTAQMVVHPDLHLYGRIVSEVSVETVQGTEWLGNGATGEMVRTSNVRIEEEL